MAIPFYNEVLLKSINLIDEKLLSYAFQTFSFEVNPLFITPNEQIYYSNTHSGANIHDTYRECDSLIYLKQLPYTASLVKQKQFFQSVGEQIKVLREKQHKILDAGKHIANPSNITQLMARQYVNLNFNAYFANNLPYEVNYATSRNIFNQSMTNIIQGILGSKYCIYEFFINLCEKLPAPKEALESVRKILLGNRFEYASLMENGFSFSKSTAIFIDSQFINDILIYCLGFDKIETQRNKTITTTKLTGIHERFFNYEIMEFDIVKQPLIFLNNRTNCFEKISNDWFENGLERELEKEIELIKKKVPYADRYKYMI